MLAFFKNCLFHLTLKHIFTGFKTWVNTFFFFHMIKNSTYFYLSLCIFWQNICYHSKLSSSLYNMLGISQIFDKVWKHLLLSHSKWKSLLLQASHSGAQRICQYPTVNRFTPNNNQIASDVNSAMLGKGWSKCKFLFSSFSLLLQMLCLQKPNDKTVNHFFLERLLRIYEVSLV